MSEENTQQEMSDEEAIIRIAQAMKDNAPTQDEKVNVHTFLTNVVHAEEIDKVSKVGNLRNDKELDELGVPVWNTRGNLEMSLISDKIMNNEFFKDYFNRMAFITLATSLSREGFMIKSAVTQTKQVADITKRKKINKGWFKTKEESSGGDTTSNS